APAPTCADRTAPTRPEETAVQFDVQPSGGMVDAESRAASLAAPGFGRVFTDHMISARWTEDSGWHDARLEPYAPLARDPALLIPSPAGTYSSGPLRPISLWLTQEFVRAVPGGTGAAKCGGNYAASLVAQREAMDHGCDQVVFVDGVEHRWVDELAGSNIFFV